LVREDFPRLLLDYYLPTLFPPILNFSFERQNIIEGEEKQESSTSRIYNSPSSLSLALHLSVTTPTRKRSTCSALHPSHLVLSPHPITQVSTRQINQFATTKHASTVAIPLRDQGCLSSRALRGHRLIQARTSFVYALRQPIAANQKSTRQQLVTRVGLYLTRS